MDPARVLLIVASSHLLVLDIITNRSTRLIHGYGPFCTLKSYMYFYVFYDYALS